jgi:hypothetical protein
MRLPNIEWLWLIVFVVAWLWPVIRKVRSAGERDKSPPVPKPKRRPQTRGSRWARISALADEAVADQIRVLVDQIRRAHSRRHVRQARRRRFRETASAPQPAPAVSPPIRETSAIQRRHQAAASPSPIAEPQPTPASIWAEALRDRQNLRRIIIAAEIIGLPKGAWMRLHLLSVYPYRESQPV